jgi:hypothetical protein
VWSRPDFQGGNPPGLPGFLKVEQPRPNPFSRAGTARFWLLHGVTSLEKLRFEPDTGPKQGEIRRVLTLGRRPEGFLRDLVAAFPAVGCYGMRPISKTCQFPASRGRRLQFLNLNSPSSSKKKLRIFSSFFSISSASAAESAACWCI